MAYSHKSKKVHTETIAQSLRNIISYMLHVIATIYLFLMLVIMPFYYTNAYERIDVDKYAFFRRCTSFLGTVSIPLLGIYLVFLCITSMQRRKEKFSRNLVGKKDTVFSVVLKDVSSLDLFVALYGIAVSISYLFSKYQDYAWLGARGWYMGFVTQILLVLSYFFVSRFWIERVYLWIGAFVAAVGTALLAICNRFSVDVLHMGLADENKISTVGNINWFCGYLVMFWALIFALLVSDYFKNKIGKWLLFLGLGISFAAMILQGSASGYLAMGIIAMVMFLVASKSIEKTTNYAYCMVVFGVACIIVTVARNVSPWQLVVVSGVVNIFTTGVIPYILFGASIIGAIVITMIGKRSTPEGIKKAEKLLKLLGKIVVIASGLSLLIYAILVALHTQNPQIGKGWPDAIFTFNEEWGSKRGITWKIGFLCFGQQDFIHKLFGVGPDNMYCAIYLDENDGLKNLAVSHFGNAFLVNAHNEWLTVLVNLGILGLFTFGGMIVVAIARMLKADAISFACGISILAYTCNNVFSFQQVMNIVPVFLLMAMGEAVIRRNAKTIQKGNLS